MIVRDEVCGMEFPREDAACSVSYEGRTLHFCADRCRQLFLANPGWYVPVTNSDDAGS